MGVTISPLPAVATASAPPAATRPGVRTRGISVPPRETLTLGFPRLGLRRKPSSMRLNAGLTEIEPDLEEDEYDRYRTNGVEPEDFKYGEYDGHHTYFEGNEGSMRILQIYDPDIHGRSSTRLNAGLTEIKLDLEEDKYDQWRTNGVEPEDFKYGEYDGHHTCFEGNEGSFWEAVVEEYKAAEPPTGFQGIMSWLFLPAIVAGLAYHVPFGLSEIHRSGPGKMDDCDRDTTFSVKEWVKAIGGEYLYIGAAIFVVVFCVIEIKKPDKPHNFEPHIYNMERGARDKLIEKYNTMDIWDFNEKYGDLWDFTVKRDDLIKELSKEAKL